MAKQTYTVRSTERGQEQSFTVTVIGSENAARRVAVEQGIQGPGRMDVAMHFDGRQIPVATYGVRNGEVWFAGRPTV